MSNKDLKCPYHKIKLKDVGYRGNEKAYYCNVCRNFYNADLELIHKPSHFK